MSRLSDFYDKVGETSGPQLSLRMEKLIKIARDFKLKFLLDLGCGDGKFTNTFASSCGATSIVGVDMSKNLAKSASCRFDSVVSTLDINLPFKDESFDAVLCSEIIEHLIDTDNMLQEVRRVLRPKGMLFLTTPNLASWINRLGLLFGYQPHFTEVSLQHNVGKLYMGATSGTSEGALAGHLRLFAPRALQQLLDIHGFRVVLRSGAGIGYNGRSILPFPLSVVDGGFSHRYSLSAFLILVCVKS